MIRMDINYINYTISLNIRSGMITKLARLVKLKALTYSHVFEMDVYFHWVLSYRFAKRNTNQWKSMKFPSPVKIFWLLELINQQLVCNVRPLPGCLHDRPLKASPPVSRRITRLNTLRTRISSMYTMDMYRCLDLHILLYIYLYIHMYMNAFASVSVIQWIHASTCVSSGCSGGIEGHPSCGARSQRCQPLAATVVYCGRRPWPLTTPWKGRLDQQSDQQETNSKWIRPQ